LVPIQVNYAMVEQGDSPLPTIWWVIVRETGADVNGVAQQEGAILWVRW
jgi:hypothetical protein